MKFFFCPNSASLKQQFCHCGVIVMAGLGLLLSANQVNAAPALALALVQEDDQDSDAEKNVEVDVRVIAADDQDAIQDVQTIEVEVEQDGDSGDAGSDKPNVFVVRADGKIDSKLADQLRKHNIKIHEALSGKLGKQGQQIIRIQADGDDVKLHEHLKKHNVMVHEVLAGKSGKQGEPKVIRIEADGDQVKVHEELAKHNVMMHEILTGGQGESSERKVIRIQADGDQIKLPKDLAKHNVMVHEILAGEQGEQGKRKVIRIQADGDRVQLDEHLESHKTKLPHVLSVDHNIAGDAIVVKVQEERAKADSPVVLGRHLVNLTHHAGGKSADHKALAKQLREIADKLDGGAVKKRAAFFLKDGDAKQEGKFRIRVERNGEKDSSHKPAAKWVADSGKQIVLQHKPNAGQFMIRKAGDGPAKKLHVQGKGQEKLFVVRKPEAEGEVVVVERRRGDEANNKFVEEELHFGDAKTSMESKGDAIAELRVELKKLRQELEQLRVRQREGARNRPAGKKKPKDRD